jgi:lipopolysaccharide/colanic/teichoic acid biosynthesis glycosyltransferase
MRRARTFVFVFGMLVVPFLVGLAHARYTTPRYTFGTQNSFWAYAALAGLHLLAAHIAGIPDEVEDVQPAFALATVTALASTGLWTALQLVRPGTLPRRVVFVAGVLAGLWSFCTSAVNVRGRRRQGLRERVAAVLTDAEAMSFSADAGRNFPLPEIAFTVTSILDHDDIESIHDRQTIQNLLAEDEPTTLVLSERSSTNQLLVDIATEMHRGGTRVRTLGDFYPEYFGKVALHDLSEMAMLFDVRSILHAPYRRTKRAIDFAGAVLAGLLCIVLFPIILVGNVLGNRGPLFFRQSRVGRNGDLFVLLKFRTMVVGEPDELPSWTTIDDPRITTFGRFLRRAHLDELPQFWNILRGELSLVGPRPEQPHYVAELRAKEVAYDLRHLVLPGLTGWAQIKFRYAATESAAIEKLQYDLFYLKHQSLALDLRILSRTLRSVLRRQGH